METVSFEFISREEHNAFERNLVLGPSTEGQLNLNRLHECRRIFTEFQICKLQT